MRRRGTAGQGGAVGGLFAFLLFGAFALLSLLIVVIGVDGYRGVVASSDENGQLRASLSYAAGKVRAGDGEGGVRAGSFGGADALILDSVIDGEIYETRIYFYDGALRELFTAADSGVGPEAGERIATLAGFAVEEAGEGLFRLTATTTDGTARTLHVAARSGR